MGESVLAAIGWLAALAIALGALATNHDVVAASALAAAALGTIALRHLQRRPPTALVDGIEAVGVAAVGVTVAAASGSTAEIACTCAIAFCAVTQQYAALVHTHIVRRPDDALVGAPLGFAATCALAAYVAAGRPLLLLVALAAWAAIECTYAAVVRGVAIARADARQPHPPILPPLANGARWRRLGEGLAGSRDTAFWGLVVARPIARVILQLVAEWRVITPNRITIASIAFAISAALAIIDGHIVAGIVLVGVRSVLDSLDGQLARYRACGTNLGSYVDKVSDLYCWAALFAALGIRAYGTEHAPAMLFLPLLSAIALALLGFSLWLARVLSSSAAAASMPAKLGFAAWLASWWRIVLFEEPDFYLWIALAVITERYALFIPLIAGAYALRALALLSVRASMLRTVGKELAV